MWISEKKLEEKIWSILKQHSAYLAKEMARIKVEHGCAHKWRKVDEAVGYYTGTRVFLVCDKCGKTHCETLAM